MLKQLTLNSFTSVPWLENSQLATAHKETLNFSTPRPNVILKLPTMPMLRPTTFRLFRFLVLVIGSLLFAGPFSIAATNDAVKVENFTPFKDLENYLADHLNSKLKEAIAQQNLAVFAVTRYFSESKSCFASVGLTEVSPADRNPRLPFFNFSGFIREKSDWDADKCGERVLANAIAAFDATPLDKLLDGIEFVRASGGTRKKEIASTSTVNVNWKGISDNDVVFSKVKESNFGKVFDYRSVQTSGYVEAVKFDGGDFMCVAFAGLSARTPDGRLFRWPAMLATKVRIQTGGTMDRCKEIVATDAIDELLSRPWTDDGLLKNFAATREDGVPLPDASKVARVKSALAADGPRSAVTAQSTSVNTLSCSNQCMNGSCTRTFTNGRKEHWQAPRKFDPVNNNWGWDITTNACGI